MTVKFKHIKLYDVHRFLSSHSMDEISQFDSVAGVWTLFACH